MARKTSSSPKLAPPLVQLQVVHEPSARALYIWNPALLRTAELAANDGNLMLAADLCRWAMGDDRVKAVLDSRTDALLGRSLSFEAGIGRKNRRALKALDLEEDWYASFPETEVKALHAWGIMLGVGLAEIRWEEDAAHDGRVLPHLEVKDPRWLRWDDDARAWKLTIANESGFGTQEIVITPGDGKWIIFTPGGRHRPWDHGCYRALGTWVLLKQYAKQDWGFVSEKLGIAKDVIAGDGGTEPQRQQMAADVKRPGRNLGFLLPKGFTYEMIEAQASTGEIFARQIAAADTGIAITVLGNNLSTQISAGDGSKAAASEHGKVALGRTKADAETLATCFHDGALTWWALYNFSDAALAPWPAWDCRPLEDLKDYAGSLQMLGQFMAQAFTAGAPVDYRGLLEKFDVPTIEAEPTPVKAAAPAPAPKQASQAEVVSLLSRLPASHPARAHHQLRERIAAAQAKEAA